jgi:hypothetical protein
MPIKIKFEESSCRPGDIVKVMVDISQANYPQWSEIQDQIRRWADERQLNLVSVVPNIIDRHQSIALAKRKINRQNDTELLNQYGKVRKISDRTLAIGHDITKRI